MRLRRRSGFCADAGDAFKTITWSGLSFQRNRRRSKVAAKAAADGAVARFIMRDMTVSGGNGNGEGPRGKAIG
ncbi:Hypothetical protein BN69_3326 [Methylocystis sp. SC2]|nr:Hypothetical protein BN69_3326 [Methylocystis sp. SC2]